MIYHPLTWVAVSVVVHAVLLNLLWAQPALPESVARLAERLGTGRRLKVRLAPATTGRALYLLGIPTLALALRVIDPEAAGLQLPRSLLWTAVAVAITGVVAGIVVAARMWLPAAAGYRCRLRLLVPTPRRIGHLALRALLKEAHWAFFRAAVLSVGLHDATQAVYISLGLLALEAWTNPWRRAAFDDVSAAPALANGASLAVLSATVFLLTGSTPLCLATHIVAAGLLAALVPQTQRTYDDATIAANSKTANKVMRSRSRRT